MPKVDLHRHLSGAIRFNTLFAMAKAAGLPLPASNPSELEALMAVYAPVNSLSELITPPNQMRPWLILDKLVTTPDIAGRIAYEAVEDAATDGVTYVEFRISPYSIEKDAGLPLPDFISGLNAGLTDAQSRFGTVGKVVLSLSRHSLIRLGNNERNEYYQRLLLAAEHSHGEPVVGFDLVGTESTAEPYHFREFFRSAKALGFGVTIHAGEGEPPANILQAITVLGADRISHATSLERDPRLLQEVAVREVVVEQCITSNVMTSIVHSIEDHPLLRLINSGVRAVLCTDDPIVFGNSLTSEYVLAATRLGITEQQMKRMNMWANEARFWKGNIIAT